MYSQPKMLSYRIARMRQWDRESKPDQGIVHDPEKWTGFPKRSCAGLDDVKSLLQKISPASMPRVPGFFLWQGRSAPTLRTTGPASTGSSDDRSLSAGTADPEANASRVAKLLSLLPMNEERRAVTPVRPAAAYISGKRRLGELDIITRSFAAAAGLDVETVNHKPSYLTP